MCVCLDHGQIVEPKQRALAVSSSPGGIRFRGADYGRRVRGLCHKCRRRCATLALVGLLDASMLGVAAQPAVRVGPPVRCNQKGRVRRARRRVSTHRRWSMARTEHCSRGRCLGEVLMMWQSQLTILVSILRSEEDTEKGKQNWKRTHNRRHPLAPLGPRS